MLSPNLSSTGLWAHSHSAPASDAPAAYLHYVLARINDHKINRLQELLPWHVSPFFSDDSKKAA